MIRPRTALPRPRTAARSAIRRVAPAAAATLVAVALGAPGASPTTGIRDGDVALASTTSMTSDTYESRVQALVNLRRSNHGLRRLRFAACPDGTAERWSRYLAEHDAFYHQSMTSVLDMCNAVYAAETLGRGSMTPRQLVRLWMESPEHRAILLSPKSRRIGIGATRDAYGRWVVAANFVRF